MYDAFGNVVNETGTVENPYRYAGYRYDKATGLYYLQARYYQPDTGRFLTLDPDPGEDKFPLTQNGYMYGDNNPVMKTDPDGHWGRLIYKLGKLVYKHASKLYKRIKNRYKIVGPDLKRNGRIFAIIDRKRGKRLFAVDYHELVRKKGKKKYRTGKRVVRP